MFMLINDIIHVYVFFSYFYIDVCLHSFVSRQSRLVLIDRESQTLMANDNKTLKLLQQSMKAPTTITTPTTTTAATTTTTATAIMVIRDITTKLQQHLQPICCWATTEQLHAFHCYK